MMCGCRRVRQEITGREFLLRRKYAPKNHFRFTTKQCLLVLHTHCFNLDFDRHAHTIFYVWYSLSKSTAVRSHKYIVDIHTHTHNPIHIEPILRQFSFITTRSCFRIIFYDTQNFQAKNIETWCTMSSAINVPLENYEIFSREKKS